MQVLLQRAAILRPDTSKKATFGRQILALSPSKHARGPHSEGRRPDAERSEKETNSLEARHGKAKHGICIQPSNLNATQNLFLSSRTVV
jgi:hypothetical protein